MKRRLAMALMMIALAGCGRVADLEPRAGKSLPEKPALASRTPTAEELLALPPQADPRQIYELNKRGEVREADRFDLPPPDGEAIPPPIEEPSIEQEPQR